MVAKRTKPRWVGGVDKKGNQIWMLNGKRVPDPRSAKLKAKSLAAFKANPIKSGDFALKRDKKGNLSFKNPSRAGRAGAKGGGGGQ